jgi:hypothetical protein
MPDVLTIFAPPVPSPDLAIPEFPPATGPLRPSKSFRPARQVLHARLSTSPLRGIKNPGTGSAVQRAGKRYEKKVLAQIGKLFAQADGITLLASPWLAFSSLANPSEERHCQPDLLISTPTEIFLCEIKLSHTVDAFWQLDSLYRPAVERLDPSRPIRLVEITRSFDPAVLFPRKMRLFFSLEHLLRTPATSAVEVLQWKL